MKRTNWKVKRSEGRFWIWACSIIGVLFIVFTVLLACATLKGNNKESEAFLKPIEPSSRHSGVDLADRFYPPVLRSLVVNPQSKSNYFDFVLDEGNKGFSHQNEIDPITRKLIQYFFLGITLPSEDFWVNLNPVQPDKIASPRLTATDIGKVLLEVDLNLKKDAARFTDPRTSLGQEYWARLKNNLTASGVESLQRLPLSRLWIVPDEAVMEEVGPDRVNIVNARLKICLESEYLRGQAGGIIPVSAQDAQERLIEDCAISAMKEVIVPVIEHDVNYSARYAPIRQVYYSLILAEYFKQKYWGKKSIYDYYINQCRLTGLYSRMPWSKRDFFNSYVNSYKKGEYSFFQQEYDPYQLSSARRHYFSGGIRVNLGDGFRESFNKMAQAESSPVVDIADMVEELSTGEWYVKATTDEVNPVELTDIKLTKAVSPEQAEQPVSSAVPKAQLAALKEGWRINIEVMRQTSGHNEFTGKYEYNRTKFIPYDDYIVVKNNDVYGELRIAPWSLGLGAMNTTKLDYSEVTELKILSTSSPVEKYPGFRKIYWKDVEESENNQIWLGLGKGKKSVRIMTDWNNPNKTFFDVWAKEGEAVHRLYANAAGKDGYTSGPGNTTENTVFHLDEAPEAYIFDVYENKEKEEIIVDIISPAWEKIQGRFLPEPITTFTGWKVSARSSSPVGSGSLIETIGMVQSLKPIPLAYSETPGIWNDIIKEIEKNVSVCFDPFYLEQLGLDEELIKQVENNQFRSDSNHVVTPYVTIFFGEGRSAPGQFFIRIYGTTEDGKEGSLEGIGEKRIKKSIEVFYAFFVWAKNKVMQKYGIHPGSVKLNAGIDSLLSQALGLQNNKTPEEKIDEHIMEKYAGSITLAEDIAGLASKPLPLAIIEILPKADNDKKGPMTVAEITALLPQGTTLEEAQEELADLVEKGTIILGLTSEAKRIAGQIETLDKQKKRNETTIAYHLAQYGSIPNHLQKDKQELKEKIETLSKKLDIFQPGYALAKTSSPVSCNQVIEKLNSIVRERPDGSILAKIEVSEDMEEFARGLAQTWGGTAVSDLDPYGAGNLHCLRYRSSDPDTPGNLIKIFIDGTVTGEELLSYALSLEIWGAFEQGQRQELVSLSESSSPATTMDEGKTGYEATYNLVRNTLIANEDFGFMAIDAIIGAVLEDDFLCRVARISKKNVQEKVEEVLAVLIKEREVKEKTTQQQEEELAQLIKQKEKEYAARIESERLIIDALGTSIKNKDMKKVSLESRIWKEYYDEVTDIKKQTPISGSKYARVRTSSPVSVEELEKDLTEKKQKLAVYQKELSHLRDIDDIIESQISREGSSYYNFTDTLTDDQQRQRQEARELISKYPRRKAEIESIETTYIPMVEQEIADIKRQMSELQQTAASPIPQEQDAGVGGVDLSRITFKVIF